MTNRKLYIIEALIILAIISLVAADNPGTRKSLGILSTKIETKVGKQS